MQPILWDKSISRDTYIQGTQYLVLEKCSLNLYICSSIEGVPQGKNDTFLAPETQVYTPFIQHLSTQNMTDHKKG